MKIDYGEWKVPVSWDEVDLKTFQQINAYYSDKDRKFNVIEVLHILTGKPEDEISQLPMDFLDIILSKLSFLNEQPKTDEPMNRIEIDGETYSINIMEKLKVGEHLAVDMTMKSDPNNTAAFLAILCRKQDEIFDTKFENEVLPERIKLFEKQPITKVIPVLGFFMNCYMLSVMPSLLSTEVQEAINQERENIMTLHKDGEVSKRTMKSVMKTLKKLEKTISGI